MGPLVANVLVLKFHIMNGQVYFLLCFQPSIFAFSATSHFQVSDMMMVKYRLYRYLTTANLVTMTTVSYAEFIVIILG